MSVIPIVLLPPMLTIPKFKLDVLGISWPLLASTASVAALLVALPSALLTTVVNRAALSVAAAAGVAYVEAVAPEITIPFLYHA